MASIMQKSFSGGELSPPLYSRTDLAKYQNALRTCRNFIVMRHGGVANRPGSEFICETKYPARTSRLIPFVYSQGDSYMLEFGHQYIRVIKNGSQVKRTAQAITAISNAAQCKVTYSGSDTYSAQDHIYISGIVGPIGNYLNNRWFIVYAVNTGTNEITLAYTSGGFVDSTSMGAYTSSGTIEEVYEITTTYAEADIPNIKYVQSADVITIVHPSYAPKNLTRVSDTNWTLSSISFDANVDYPLFATAVQNGTTGSTTYKYTITAFDPLTATETPMKTVPPSGNYLWSVTNGNATLSSTNSITLTWTITNLFGYSSANLDFNIYKESNGVYGYIGTASGILSFTDIGLSPNLTDTPPKIAEDFNATGDYPSAICYYQQRLVLANTDNDVEKVLASKTGNFYDFSVSNPVQDDDAVIFRLASSKINEVHHLLDLGTLLLFTESGEFVAQGDAGGILTPSSVNTKQSSYNGSNTRLAPIVIGNSAVYLQARGNNVRDINYQYESSNYSGNELSIFSSHLFDDYTFVDWAYQQIPHSNLWMCRSDGQLIGLTYVKEQQMLAWHRHDFHNGLVESVGSVPESTEDVVYLTINRTINGVTKRYIEKLVTRKITTVEDIVIIDSHLSYDGRNTSATTMTLSTGSGWLYTDTLTLTASASFFASTDVGNQIFLYDTDGSIIRFTIDAYTSATVVTGRPNRTVPTGLRNYATLDWAKAVDEINGLWHIEGEDVAIYADGVVVASPNNPSYETVTVANGSISLSERYSVVYIGLPICSDLQTLDIDMDNATIVDKSKLISKVTVFVDNSRGLWAGTAEPDETVSFIEGLTEYKLRENEGYDDPVELKTESIDVITEASWNKNGRVFLRQVDPVPVTILSITPSGLIPTNQG